MTGMPEPSPDCIVVGVDTSAESVAALRWAGRLASRTGASLLAVHAEGLLEEGAYVPRVDVTELVGTMLSHDHLDVSVTSLVEPGHPTDTLLRVAERTGATHIVVGHRGVGATASDIGSTAMSLVTRAAVPVTVVRSD